MHSVPGEGGNSPWGVQGLGVSLTMEASPLCRVYDPRFTQLTLQGIYSQWEEVPLWPPAPLRLPLDLLLP